MRRALVLVSSLVLALMLAAAPAMAHPLNVSPPGGDTMNVAGVSGGANGQGHFHGVIVACNMTDANSSVASFRFPALDLPDACLHPADRD